MLVVVAIAAIVVVTGAIGLIVVLATPREQRGNWLGITLAMVAFGSLGWLVAMALMFGPT